MDNCKEKKSVWAYMNLKLINKDITILLELYDINQRNKWISQKLYLINN